MRFKTTAFAFATILALGCGTGTTGDDDVLDPEANPEDYAEGAFGVSEACGGKCDDPNAVLNVSQTRLLASLDMADYFAEDGESESFTLTGELLEVEDEDAPEAGHTLDLEIWANDGASNPDFKIPAVLTFDGERYTSETIDSSDLIPWQLLRIDVTGTHAARDIVQGFEYAPGFDIGDEVVVHGETADPWADAKNVDLPVIQLDAEMEVPAYDRATETSPFGLGGTEFWQRWPGGHSPTFSYSAGTDYGRKCMYASARRFEAIMREAPQSMHTLYEESNWSGRFFNWNDDYSDEAASGRPRGAVLWAWRTGLIKWISQTGADGACFLPTLNQVERAAQSCLNEAERSDGEIEGCQAG